jgi:hypothetical protein
MLSAPANLRDMELRGLGTRETWNEREMERRSADAETSSEQMETIHTKVKYEMQANYVDALQAAQTMWENQRWVLSMPMTLCCTFVYPALEVMITFGLCVRKWWESRPPHSPWTYGDRYGAKWAKLDINLIQCAGIRRRHKDRKRWLGWNWVWKLEILSDLI